MTPTELHALIAAGESQTLEFKSSFDNAALQSLVAFANAQGGRVLVGLSDMGQTIGASKHPAPSSMTGNLPTRSSRSPISR